MAKATLCAIGECGKISHARKMCFRHYMQWWKHGVAGGGHPRKPLAEQLGFVEHAALYSDEGCLIWPYSRDPRGYAFITEYSSSTGKCRKIFIHRRVCEILHGPAPEGKNNAAHYCGKGHLGCVAGNHLRWATHQENMDDKRIHGTMRNGSGHRHGSTAGMGRKLTDRDVISIRSMACEKKAKDLALLFGVSRSMIGHIVNRRKWASV